VLAASANDADFCTSHMSPVHVSIYFRHKCAAAKLIAVLISNCMKVHITVRGVLLHTLYCYLYNYPADAENMASS